MRTRCWLACAIGALMVTMMPDARAADPQPYSVAIATTGNSALDTALKDASQLEALRQKAPVSPYALVSRAKEDLDRFATVL